jgi:hypothetical protein
LVKRNRYRSYGGKILANQIPVWKTFHTVGLGAILGVSVLMAVIRPFSQVGSWIAVMGLILACFLITADRNKVSLSRFQMVIWTMLIMSAMAVIFVWRATDNAATSTAITFDPQLIALMGISTTSLVGSPFIKKRQGGVKLTVLNAAGGARAGELVHNDDFSHASWADMFMGEKSDDHTILDLGKVQMFLFTILLVVTYGYAIYELLAQPTAPDTLPDVGDMMVALLGISHGGYLINKAIPPAQK